MFRKAYFLLVFLAAGFLAAAARFGALASAAGALRAARFFGASTSPPGVCRTAIAALYLISNRDLCRAVLFAWRTPFCAALSRATIASRTAVAGGVDVVAQNGGVRLLHGGLRRALDGSVAKVPLERLTVCLFGRTSSQVSSLTGTPDRWGSGLIILRSSEWRCPVMRGSTGWPHSAFQASSATSFERLRRVDDDDASRLAFDDRQEPLTHALVKGVGLAADGVARFRGAVARLRASARGRDRSPAGDREAASGPACRPPVAMSFSDLDVARRPSSRP